MLKLIAHFVVTSAEQAVDRWLRVPENWISHQFSNQFLTSQQSFPEQISHCALFFDTRTWNKEQIFGFCVSCFVLQQWLFCYEIEGEGDTSGLPPPYAYNKQQQSCNWLPHPLPELISFPCEDNPTSIENNPHLAKLLQETLLERSFPWCSIVWVIVANFIDIITEIKAFYGKHHHHWNHHQSLSGKHHREKAPSSESLHCGSPRLHTGREPICWASNAQFNHHCKAALQFNYIIKLFYTYLPSQ